MKNIFIIVFHYITVWSAASFAGIDDEFTAIDGKTSRLSKHPSSPAHLAAEIKKTAKTDLEKARLIFK